MTQFLEETQQISPVNSFRFQDTLLTINMLCSTAQKVMVTTPAYYTASITLRKNTSVTTPRSWPFRQDSIQSVERNCIPQTVLSHDNVT